jgi:hypothetical protein
MTIKPLLNSNTAADIPLRWSGRYLGLDLSKLFVSFGLQLLIAALAGCGKKIAIDSYGM